MKHLASICIVAILATTILSSCTKEEPGTTPIEEPQNLYEDVLCSSVFLEGDYSSLCRLDSALPNIPLPNPPGNTNTCFYDISNQSEVIYILTFEILNSPEIAQGDVAAYNFTPIGGDTGLQSKKEISNVGDKALFLRYIQESNTDLQDNALVVAHSNAWFIMYSQHDLNEEEPCSHTEDEMVEFAKEFIENL